MDNFGEILSQRKTINGEMLEKDFHFQLEKQILSFSQNLCSQMQLETFVLSSLKLVKESLK